MTIAGLPSQLSFTARCGETGRDRRCRLASLHIAAQSRRSATQPCYRPQEYEEVQVPLRYLHTMVRVANIEKSLEFYCKKLGMEEVRRTESEAGRYTLIFLAAPQDKDQAVTQRAPLLELTFNWDPENYGEGRDTEVLTDPRDVASTIVKCADDIELPELVELLPTRPVGAVVCRLCEGSRWELVGADRWCCRRCHGLGWTLA